MDLSTALFYLNLESEQNRSKLVIMAIINGFGNSGM